ncbi:MAG: tetratricopeptide repeat protein [bacterium]
MENGELLGWIESPSGHAKILVRDGYFYNDKWQNGTVHLKPPNSSSFELTGFYRPMEAVINDLGCAVIADWLSSDDLNGMLYFVRPNGTIIRKHQFNVNLGNLAIDPDGALVFVTTAASEFEDSKLLCYDVQTGEIIWDKIAPKPAARITVVPSENSILVGEPYMPCGRDYILKIAFTGEILERWPDSPYQAVEFGEMELKAGRHQEAERWFQVAAQSDISERHRAKACKALGEMAEDAKRFKDALKYYEKALHLDPKSGVKRKIDSLQKK